MEREEQQASEERPVVADNTQTESDDPDKALDILLQTKEWLHTQILEYKAAILAAKNKCEVRSTDDPEIVLNRISGLQQKAQDASTEYHIRELILHRLLMTQTLTSDLFPPPVNSKNTNESQPPESKKFLPLVQKQTELSSKVLKVHEEIENLQPELEELKKKNLELMRSSREIMAELQTLRDTASKKSKGKDSQEIKSAHERLESKVAKLEVCRHTFQGLVLGSGVHWAADSRLCPIVLKLGVPISELMKAT